MVCGIRPAMTELGSSCEFASKNLMRLCGIADAARKGAAFRQQTVAAIRVGGANIADPASAERCWWYAEIRRRNEWCSSVASGVN